MTVYFCFLFAHYYEHLLHFRAITTFMPSRMRGRLMICSYRGFSSAYLPARYGYTHTSLPPAILYTTTPTTLHYPIYGRDDACAYHSCCSLHYWYRVRYCVFGAGRWWYAGVPLPCSPEHSLGICRAMERAVVDVLLTTFLLSSASYLEPADLNLPLFIPLRTT